MVPGILYAFVCVVSSRKDTAVSASFLPLYRKLTGKKSIGMFNRALLLVEYRSNHSCGTAVFMFSLRLPEECDSL